MNAHYTSAEEALALHVKRCDECKNSAFGLCATGFRILGELAQMRQSPQLDFYFVEHKELFDRPLVKAAIRNSHN